MRFRQIDLPVHDPSGWSAWMTRELDVPPHPVMPDAVTVGWSTLRFRYRPEADVTVRTGPDADSGTPQKRAHHLAFAVPTGTIDDYAREYGEDTVDRPDGPFAMRSVYLTGPEDAVIELVEHVHRPADGTDAAQLLGVAEVGLGVPDVRASGEALAAHYGDRLPHGFGDPDRRIIAAYGDIDGAVVLSAADRPWFPTEDTFPVTDQPSISLGN
ncbi:hypothetical protein [Corynebacterium variabile]|uniref:hypothetical protein n=1 Tax=Corynebacterium variabile TaxID=1727 RepID=UPI001D66B0E1|nr:hypothetical protein [Corynebacterium variabile]HJG45813.1 hypothetical protein [Corynebacterium variabile]